MKKVLIITYYWVPSGGAGVQRWIRFVKHLREFGWEPIIYAPKDPNYALVDEGLAAQIPDDIKVYRHKIREVNSILPKLSFSKKREGNSLYKLQQQKGKNRSFAQKAAWFARGNFFIPDARFMWIKPSARYLDKVMEAEQFDAVVSTGPPHSLHLIAQRLRRKHKFLWIADFRDPWTSMDYLDEMFLTSFARKKHERLEKSVVTSADKLVVVGRAMYNEYKENYDVEAEIIYNGYEEQSKEEQSFELDEKFTIVHIGSFLKNRNCDDLWKVLGELINARADFANKLEIRLIGNVAPNVLESIERFGLNNHLNKIDYVPYEETQKYLYGAQTLLLPIDRIKNAEFVLTGKLFEYLKSKRPVLLLAPANGDAFDVVEQCQAGYCCDFDDEQTIRRSLETMFDLYKEGKNTINSVNVEQFSGKALTGKLTTLLNEELKKISD